MHQVTQFFSTLVTQYGSISIFILLALGIVGLPIPDETLLAFTGLLIAEGKLSFYWCFPAAIAGSICGITISYILGRTAGNYLVEHYGSKVGISHKKLQHVHKWFEKIGKWTLFVGYFIPGVRHLTGYVAGTTLVHYRIFSLFAYLGALLWVSIFLSLGYFLGEKIFTLLQKVDREFLYIILGAAVLLLAYYFWWKRKK